MDCDVIDFRIYEIKCDKTASKRLCGQEQVCLRKTLRLLVLDGLWKGRGGVFVGQDNIALIRQLAASSDPEDPACRRTHAAAAAARTADTLSQPVSVRWRRVGGGGVLRAGRWEPAAGWMNAGPPGPPGRRTK